MGPITAPQEPRQGRIGLGTGASSISIRHPQASLTPKPRAVWHRVMERFWLGCSDLGWALNVLILLLKRGPGE
eukprot:5181896-Pyramimonas_sp.AAC.1